MIRNIIRYSQRLAGLLLIAAIAIVAVEAQTQNQTDIATKPPERLREIDKGAAGKTAGKKAAEDTGGKEKGDPGKPANKPKSNNQTKPGSGGKADLVNCKCCRGKCPVV